MRHPIVQITHDPFARFATMRKVVRPTKACAWCGQPARFVYGTEPDDHPITVWDTHAFCSIACYRTYHS